MIELELAISPFLLLGAALPGAINLGQSLLNKPKEEDFRPNTAGMERFRAYLRGRTASSEVAHQALQPQLSAIGQQTRQTERKIQSAVGRGDLSASEEAQIQISQGQAASSVAQQAGEQAFEAQRQENRRVGQQVAQIESNIAQAKEQAKIDYERATKQHRQQVTGAALQLGAGVASAGISSHLQAVAASKSALDAGLAAGTVAAGTTAKELGAKALEAGFTDPRQYVQLLGNREKMRSTLDQFSETEFEAAGFPKSVAEAGIRTGTFTAAEQTKLLKELGQGRTNAVIDIGSKITSGEIKSIDEIKALDNVSDPVKIQLANMFNSRQSGQATIGDIEIDQMILDDNVEGLRGALKPGMKKTDATKITNALLSAQTKADKKLIADAKALSPDTEEIEAFTAAKSGLYRNTSFLVSELPSHGGTALLNEIGLYDGTTAITEAGAKSLNDKINTYVTSLPIETAKKLYRSALKKDVGVNVSEVTAKKALITWLGSQVDKMLLNRGPIGSVSGGGNSLGLDLGD
jgi:hypothetical protein